MRSFEARSLGSCIVFGAGTLTRVGLELRRLSASRALVVSTPGREDLAREVAQRLGECAVGVFAGAVEHTPVEVTERAMAQARDLGADSVVSVGGGSAVGLGKAVAVRLGVPHLVVATTYSGSEVTPVLGETADGEKTTRSDPSIRPATVLYDVDLTMTLPWETTVTSAVNAMAHAVEASYAADRTAETDEQAADAIRALAGGLRALQADPASREARADLLYGAWLAGTCLSQVQMGLHHKLCHTLGGSFGLPHAPTHTVVLSYVMAWNAPAAEPAMSRVAGALGVDDAPSGVQQLVESLGGPTDLAALGLTEADVPRAAELATDPATSRAYPNPREVTRDGVADLLTRAVRGTPIGESR